MYEWCVLIYLATLTGAVIVMCAKIYGINNKVREATQCVRDADRSVKENTAMMTEINKMQKLIYDVKKSRI